MTDLRVGTRASVLALTQTRLVIDALLEQSPSLEVELVHIQTEGDVSTTPLSQSPKPGVSVSALRDALLAGEVDVIVHSLKDLPAAPHPGIATACIPQREDPRDALVSNGGHTLDSLPSGSRVGTSSPRRAATIRRARPDLDVLDIRGNVDTRIGKVRNGDFDATLLALAGLRRIGREAEVAQLFEPEFLTPAPGQGALSVECRDDDERVLGLFEPLDHPESRITVAAERELLVGLKAGCATPIGGFAARDGDILTLRAELSSPDGRENATIVDSIALTSDPVRDARELGLRVAHALLVLPVGRTVNPL